MMQQDDNQKNLLLAIVLSIGVLLFWQFYYAGPKMQQERDRVARQEQTQQAPAPGARGAGAPVAAPEGSPVAAPGSAPVAAPGTVPGAATPAGAVHTRETALKSSPRIAIATPSLTGSVSLRGGRIDDLVLVKYREQVSPTSPNVVLFSPAEAPNAYFAEHGWVAAGGSTVKLPGRDTVWTAESTGQLTPANPARLTWDNGEGLLFRRIITVDNEYMFTVRDEVENKSQTAQSLFPYARIYRVGTPKLEGFFILHEGLIGVIGEQGLQEIKYASVLEEGGNKTIEKALGGWLGITDKYWAAAVVPSQTMEYRASFLGIPGSPGQREAFQTDYLAAMVTVAPGATGSTEGHLFAGAKEVNVIDGYAEKLTIKKFDLLVDWGWFYFITKPLFHLIHWLASWFASLGATANFGLAILATTVLVKLVFFPLANKSYESMAKMKNLQPEMEKLRERYKDDRAKQQQELMALYKKEKINPLAGCLPILLQIPVFFALYKVLFVTIDMRHAPFYGWIKDLSAPDPTSLFNLFGLLPYTVPDFLHIGVWPIIMGITMWVQMQLNPQQPDPLQQKIFNWMPVLFTFLLASFPAGLVIYWAWNNVLSLLQQYAIMRKNNTEVHLWKNLGIEKWLASRRAADKK